MVIFVDELLCLRVVVDSFSCLVSLPYRGLARPSHPASLRVLRARVAGRSLGHPPEQFLRLREKPETYLVARAALRAGRHASSLDYRLTEIRNQSIFIRFPSVSIYFRQSICHHHYLVRRFGSRPFVRGSSSILLFVN